MSAGLKSVPAFIWVLCLMAGSAYAQSSLPACQGNDLSMWTNCFGSFNYRGNKYIGEYKGGKPNGQGIYVYSNGSKYVGGLKDDKFNGQGIWYKPDGSVFVSGDFSNDQLVRSIALDTNRFPFNAPSQATSGQPSTPGKIQLAVVVQSPLPACQGDDVSRWTNCFGSASYGGDLYEGTFRNGKIDGKGRYKFTNGNNYVGEFKDGLRNGEGITYGNTNRILGSGRWKDGQLEASYQLDSNSFSISSFSSLVTSNSGNADSLRVDRLQAEVEVERQKRQDLELRLAAAQAQINSPQQSLPKPIDATVRSAHALVIGNAAYPGSNRLDNTINDANAISQKLRSMGFTVTTVKDTNRQQLVQAMSQFKRSAASAELSLFFYAGHGVQIFGTNYILPTDVDQNDVAQATIQGVSLNSVVENFLPGKTKLVFLDACRDNPLQRSGDRSVSKGLAPISVAQGTLISYATKDGQTASDGAGAKNSPFTQALLQHLDDPADIAVVLRKVREKVMLATAGKQQPWEYGSLTGGELVLSKIKGGR